MGALSTGTQAGPLRSGANMLVDPQTGQPPVFNTGVTGNPPGNVPQPRLFAPGQQIHNRLAQPGQMPMPMPGQMPMMGFGGKGGFNPNGQINFNNAQYAPSIGNGANFAGTDIHGNPIYGNQGQTFDMNGQAIDKSQMANQYSGGKSGFGGPKPQGNVGGWDQSMGGSQQLWNQYNAPRPSGAVMQWSDYVKNQANQPQGPQMGFGGPAPVDYFQQALERGDFNDGRDMTEIPKEAFGPDGKMRADYTGGFGGPGAIAPTWGWHPKWATSV